VSRPLSAFDSANYIQAIDMKSTLKILASFLMMISAPKEPVFEKVTGVISVY
jgi:hypothetical protein